MGNVVIIDHSSGTSTAGPFTLYAHLQSIDVADGTSVSQMDAIGTVGLTQTLAPLPRCSPRISSGGEHLHFEVKGHNGLGDADDETVDNGHYWGYTLNHPDEYGYRDPVTNLDLVTAIPDTTVQVSTLGAGVFIRVGPRQDYRCFDRTTNPADGCKGLSAGEEFIAFGVSDGTTGCSAGWYQIRNPTLGLYFPDLSRGSSTIPDAWVCRGDAGEVWIETGPREVVLPEPRLRQPIALEPRP